MKHAVVWILTFGLVVAYGCDGDGGYKLDPVPALDLTIQGQYVTTWAFSPDLSGGQLKQRVRVLVRNSGGGDLQLSALTWDTQNGSMTVGYPAGKPGFPLVLSENASVAIDVNYAPDPDAPDRRPGRLTIATDQGAPVRLNFTVPAGGPSIRVEPTSAVSHDPPVGQALAACFWISNVGGAPLTLTSIDFDTATAICSIVSGPDPGTVIAAYGSAANPFDAPDRRKFCVRLVPHEPESTGCVAVVRSDDPARPKAKVSVKTKYSPPTDYRFSNPSHPGQLWYDLQGASAGAERCIRLTNKGPASVLLNGAALRSVDGANPPAALDQRVAVRIRLVVPGAESPEIALPYAAAADREVDICVVDKHGTDPEIPPGVVALRYANKGQPRTLTFPVFTGLCGAGSLVAPPFDKLVHVHASPGQVAQVQVSFANQGCGPVNVLQTCVVALPLADPENPCTGQGAASFSVQASGAQGAMKPWQHKAVAVTFAPGVDAAASSDALLYLRACNGEVAGGVCKGALVHTATRLVGVVGEPGGTVTLAHVGGEAPGKPLRLTAELSDDVEAVDFGGWRWWLLKRPTGSKLWSNGETWLSAEPRLDVIADASGAYVFGVQAILQAVSPKLPIRATAMHTITVKIP